MDYTQNKTGFTADKYRSFVSNQRTTNTQKESGLPLASAFIPPQENVGEILPMSEVLSRGTIFTALAMHYTPKLR